MRWSATCDYSVARIVGDQVVAGVPVELALERASRLTLLLQASGISRVSTEALARAVRDLSNPLDGPPLWDIAAGLRDDRPLLFADTEGKVTGTTLWPKPGDPDGNKVGDGGRVVVKSDATVEVVAVAGPRRGKPITFPAIFTVAYAAADVTKCHWIQFFWEEAIYTGGTKAGRQKDKDLDAPNGKYQLTESPPPKAADLHVDTYTQGTSPYVDERQDAWNNSPTGDELGFPDSPGSTISDDRIKNSGDASKIEVTTHFQDFLVCNGAVIYELDLDVTYTWDKTANSTARSVKNVAGKGAVGDLRNSRSVISGCRDRRSAKVAVGDH